MRSRELRRAAAITAALIIMGGAMATAPGQAATVEEQIKELQGQVSLLTQQAALANLQANQSVAAQTSILTALKAQVDAQSGLDKAKASSEFARLAGIKEGLAAVGAPLGKEGAITVTAGTAGALMLGLRAPMLKGLDAAAAAIVTEVVGAIAVAAPAPSGSTATGTGGAAATPAATGAGAAMLPATGIPSAAATKRAVYLGSDAQVQSALQSKITGIAIAEAANALAASTTPVQTKLGTASIAFFTEAAAAGLVLNTLVGLEKFFRVDTTYTVFDAGEEAQQILLSMLHRKLQDAKIELRNLSAVSIPTVVAQADAAQKALLALKRQHEQSSIVAARAEKLPDGDAKKASAAEIDRLKADLAVSKATLDALHPALKPDAFWAYVQGRVSDELMSEGGKTLPRLVVAAKAQTIQVLEKRTWRSDKIFGRSDMQIEYRLLDDAGRLLSSGIRLASFNADPAAAPDALFTFPQKLAQQGSAP